MNVKLQLQKEVYKGEKPGAYGRITLKGNEQIVLVRGSFPEEVNIELVSEEWEELPGQEQWATRWATQLQEQRSMCR